MKISDLTDKKIIDQYSRVKKMSYKQFCDWLMKLLRNQYEDGLHEGESEGSWWTDEQIYDLLLSEGIDEDVAVKITNKLVEGTDVSRS